MELNIEFEEGLEDQIELGDQLIHNYIMAIEDQPSTLELFWAVDQIRNRFGNPSDGQKFLSAISKAWPLSNHLHESRTFLARFGVSKSMQNDMIGGKSPIFTAKVGSYETSLRFKV